MPKLERFTPVSVSISSSGRNPNIVLSPTKTWSLISLSTTYARWLEARCLVSNSRTLRTRKRLFTNIEFDTLRVTRRTVKERLSKSFQVSCALHAVSPFIGFRHGCGSRIRTYRGVGRRTVDHHDGPNCHIRKPSVDHHPLACQPLKSGWMDVSSGMARPRPPVDPTLDLTFCPSRHHIQDEE